MMPAGGIPPLVADDARMVRFGDVWKPPGSWAHIDGMTN